MSDSINEQRCPHGLPHSHETWDPKLDRPVQWCVPGPSVVTPPAQDEQREFVTYGPTPLPAAPSVSTDHKGAIQRLLNAAHGKPFLTEDMIWSAQAEMNALIESARPDPYLVRDTIGRFRRDVVEHLEAEAKRHAASWPDDRRYQQGIEYAAARLRAGWPTEAQHG